MRPPLNPPLNPKHEFNFYSHCIQSLNYSQRQIWYAMSAVPVFNPFSSISVTPLNATITGCEIALTADQPRNITCSIDMIKYDGRENITFLWTYDDEMLPRPRHTFVRHDENKTTLGSMLDYNFAPGDENKTLVCVIQYFYNPSATKTDGIHVEFLGQLQHCTCHKIFPNIIKSFELKSD